MHQSPVYLHAVVIINQVSTSSVVRTDYGLGHLILTTGSLLLLKSGCKMESVKHITRISKINSKYAP